MKTYIEAKTFDLTSILIVGIFLFIMIGGLLTVIFTIKSINSAIEKTNYDKESISILDSKSINSKPSQPILTAEKSFDETIVSSPTKDPSDKSTYAKLVYIDISEQKLYAYEYGKVQFSTPITSGKDLYPTVKGKFSIQTKIKDTHLEGYDTNGHYYDVPVHYWMPFFEDYGMHDTPTPTNYGGQDYHTKGSLGCIRTPLNVVEQIYNWGEIGTPVWVN